MITYIKGSLTYKSPTYVIVETGGIGYHVNVSLHTYSQIESLEQVQLLTHLSIKEDSHSLFGFASEKERNLFNHLISVSGIGTNTARIVLSGLSPEEARQAIVGEDVQTLSKVKGIGPKTAKRVILDLKDKLIKDGGPAERLTPSGDNTLREEALSALMGLGFQKIKIQKVLKMILQKPDAPSSLEALIKQALRQLS